MTTWINKGAPWRKPQAKASTGPQLWQSTRRELRKKAEGLGTHRRHPGSEHNPADLEKRTGQLECKPRWRLHATKAEVKPKRRRSQPIFMVNRLKKLNEMAVTAVVEEQAGKRLSGEVSGFRQERQPADMLQSAPLGIIKKGDYERVHGSEAMPHSCKGRGLYQGAELHPKLVSTYIMEHGAWRRWARTSEERGTAR